MAQDVKGKNSVVDSSVCVNRYFNYCCHFGREVIKLFKFETQKCLLDTEKQ